MLLPPPLRLAVLFRYGQNYPFLALGPLGKTLRLRVYREECSRSRPECYSGDGPGSWAGNTWWPSGHTTPDPDVPVGVSAIFDASLAPPSPGAERFSTAEFHVINDYTETAGSSITGPLRQGKVLTRQDSSRLKTFDEIFFSGLTF